MTADSVPAWHAALVGLLRKEDPRSLATALDAELERLAQRLASRAAEVGPLDDDLDAELDSLIAAVASFPA